MFFLKKIQPTSAANRNSYKFYNVLNYQYKFKKLIFFKKWKSGRNDSGQIIFKTRSALLRKIKNININYCLRYLKLGTILSFNFIPFKNKVLSLIFFSNGAISYYLTSEFFKLFSYTFYNNYKRFNRFKIKQTNLMLFQIKKLTFVSHLELLPGMGSQYCLSSGTKSKIIKFDETNHSVLVQLPSGIKKIFSYYSFVLLGRISISLHFKCFNTKSGYWREFGRKSIVRGVAMNAVDHPNGGQTKSLKYPRTPWGKTTKFK
jgi:large subunit ribosomal protein L2